MYFKKDTALPKFIPLPLFIVERELSPSAKIVYSLLLYRVLISQKNGWEDENGSVFVIYPVRELAKDTGKNEKTIRQALDELQKGGLAERNRRFCNKPDYIFLKYPEDRNETPAPEENYFSAPERVEAPAPETAENSALERAEEPAPDNKENTETKYIENIQEEKANPDDFFHVYGIYKNVFLRNSDVNELKKRYPDFWDTYINALSIEIDYRKRPCPDCAAELFRKLSEAFPKR